MSERSPESTHEQIRELLDSVYRADSGRILATLIRLLGDFDLAEEAMHEAFATALSLYEAQMSVLAILSQPRKHSVVQISESRRGDFASIRRLPN